MRLIDTALEDQILDQATDRVVGECGDYSSIQTKATLQATRNVVFATTFPDLKSACGMNASFTRIEAQHYFAKTDDVPATIFF
jgi:hypothetical protein